MEQFSERIRHDAEELRTLSEEFCEQLDETREDIAEELEEAEWRWHHVENRIASLGGKVREPAREVANAFETVADELRDTFRELRRFWR